MVTDNFTATDRYEAGVDSAGVRAGPCFIDCFDTGLHELPRKLQRDARTVALHIAKSGRFSAFEASDNQDIARSITRVLASGWFEVDNSCAYPWTKVALTEKGRADLLGVTLPTPELSHD